MTTEPHTSEDGIEDDTPHKKGPGIIFIIALVIFIAIAAYVLLTPSEDEIELEAPLAIEQVDPTIRRQIEDVQRNQPQPPPEVDNSIATDEPAPQPEIQPETAPIPTDLPPGDAAREMIAKLRSGEQTATLDQLFNQATKLLNESRETDAYLLYFYAAREGHGPSAMQLGAMNDPLYFTGKVTVLREPSPVQAHKWYEKAVSLGIDGAEERLNALRESIETAAADGDTKAQRILLNWK